MMVTSGVSKPVLALFPGQGSQIVGMSRKVAENSPHASEVFDAASNVLGIDARALCWRTPIETLTLTENAQPAITIASLASWAATRGDLADAPTTAAGHSVGAIAAAVAAGCLSLSSAFELAAARGQLMADVPGRGSMLAVAVGAVDSVDEQEQRAQSLANRFALDVGAVNGPTQIVLSGEHDAVVAASEELGGKAKQLAVSHAFHSRMMVPAEERWQALIERIEIGDPEAGSYHGCITGARAQSAVSVRQDLASSLTMPVLWSRVMTATKDLPEEAVA